MDSRKEQVLTRKEIIDADETKEKVTFGEKLRTLRKAKNMTIVELAGRCDITDRAIRYIEANKRTPGLEVTKKMSEALGVGTEYFMDDVLYKEEKEKEELLNGAMEKYGSRGKSQAKRIYEQTQALFAGGQLAEEDKEAFRDLMMDLFFETKEEAKKYTPKKYQRKKTK